jgi:hypothetical protein
MDFHNEHLQRHQLMEDIRNTTGGYTHELPPPRVTGGYRRAVCTVCKSNTWSPLEVTGSVQCNPCLRGERSGVPCGICFEPCRPCITPCNLGQNMDSGHVFCNTCIGTYITSKVQEGAHDICCPNPECTVSYSWHFLKTLKRRGIVNDGTMQRYQELRNADRADRLREILSGQDEALTTWAKTNLQSCPHCACLRPATDLTHRF